MKADAGELSLPAGQTTAVCDECYRDDNESVVGEGQTLVDDDGKRFFCFFYHRLWYRYHTVWYFLFSLS
jgi:hypothetical protein